MKIIHIDKTFLAVPEIAKNIYKYFDNPTQDSFCNFAICEEVTCDFCIFSPYNAEFYTKWKLNNFVARAFDSLDMKEQNTLVIRPR